MQRKDALTDLVEHVQSTPPVSIPAQPAPTQQVVSQTGETITLGQQQAK